MGNRLSQIATRTGDQGTTGLGDNTRVSKHHLRVHAMGDVDELNSHIGLLLCETMPDDVRRLLVEIQHQLFNLGGELSIPGFELLKKEAIVELDEACPSCRSSFCRLVAAPRRKPMFAARWRAGPSGQWWRWASRRRSTRHRAST